MHPEEGGEVKTQTKEHTIPVLPKVCKPRYIFYWRSLFRQIHNTNNSVNGLRFMHIVKQHFCERLKMSAAVGYTADILSSTTA